jgi:hypothetical protein
MNLFNTGLLSLSLVTAACSGASTGAVSSSTESTRFAEVTPASGSLTLESPSPAKRISGFIFTNRGASEVTISHFAVQLADGSLIRSEVGVGLASGRPITFLFDSAATHEVTSLSFTIGGSTERLVVESTDTVGRVPAK